MKNLLKNLIATTAIVLILTPNVNAAVYVNKVNENFEQAQTQVLKYGNPTVLGKIQTEDGNHAYYVDSMGKRGGFQIPVEVQAGKQYQITFDYNIIQGSLEPMFGRKNQDIRANYHRYFALDRFSHPRSFSYDTYDLTYYYSSPNQWTTSVSRTLTINQNDINTYGNTLYMVFQTKNFRGYVDNIQITEITR